MILFLMPLLPETFPRSFLRSDYLSVGSTPTDSPNTKDPNGDRYTDPTASYPAITSTDPSTAKIMTDTSTRPTTASNTSSIGPMLQNVRLRA
jgi:hypothetical protein